MFDRIGVLYNCPNAAQNGTFEYCEGDNQDPPGIYTSNGQVVTYTQPPESLGPISTMPYDPKIPASSNCVPLQSAALFTDLPAATGASTAASGSATATGSSSGSAAASGSATRTGSGSTASATGATGSNGAGALGVSVASTLAGVLAAVAFLA